MNDARHCRFSYLRARRRTRGCRPAAGCGADLPGGWRGRPPTAVVTTRGRAVEWRDTIEALGTARANESVTLTAKVSETVRKVAFDSGDIVRAGDMIVDLSSGAQLAGLEEARAAFQEAERQLARGQELAQTKVISESQLDTLRSTRDAAKARMDVVRAQLSDRVITAPFDGILGLRQVSPGSLVTPGTAIATLDDISVIKLDFTVPERYLAVLARGPGHRAHSETYPDRKFGGKVASVDSRVDPVTRSVTVRAEIAERSSGCCARACCCRSTLLPSRRDRRSSCRRSPCSRSARTRSCTGSSADQTVERAKVELGSRRRGEVEVVAGLEDGDAIVTEGTVKLREGAQRRRGRRARAARGGCRDPSDLSIRRPVFATVMSLLLVVLGVIAYHAPHAARAARHRPADRLGRRSSYPGASAAVVETRITQVLEDALSGHRGRRDIESRSSNGEGSISIEFSLDARHRGGGQRRARRGQPRASTACREEADPPEIEKAESDSEVILWLNMRSTRMDTLELTDYADRYVVDRLSSLDGVAQRARSAAAQRYAMRVWLDSAALAARGSRSPTSRPRSSARTSSCRPGRIESTDRDFTLRVQRGYREPADFAQLTLAKGEDGYLVRLGDVARVERASEERRAYFRSNGVPERRARHRQDLDGEQPRRRARRARDRGGDPEEPARGHADLRRLRQRRCSSTPRSSACSRRCSRRSRW